MPTRLLSSISCLAEFPEAVENLFVTKEFQSSGQYVLRLYCTGRQRWEHVVVDDYVPVFTKHLARLVVGWDTSDCAEDYD